jgi:hypothetical protein
VKIDALRWSQLEFGRQGDPKLETPRPSRFAGAATTPDAACPHPFETAGGDQARRASPPLRGIVPQQVDDVKTIYSQKQMSINGEVLEVLKAERGPIFPHSSDCAVAW